MAAGMRPGFAQSVFQVGGNFGSALGPLLAAFIVLPFGQGSIAWFSLVAVLAMVVLFKVGTWYKGHLARLLYRSREVVATLSRRRLVASILILVVLTFSKAVYGASLTPEEEVVPEDVKLLTEIRDALTAGRAGGAGGTVGTEGTAPGTGPQA